MAEGSPKDGNASKEADSSNEGGLWSGIKSLLFGENAETSLRKELEEALDEYDEEDEEDHPPVKGDLSAIERQMLRNLLHFSEHTVDDVAVPRADIVAIEETASFADLAALFAEAGHSRIPVYRENLDTIVGMIHIRDAFAILAGKAPAPDTLAPLIRQPLYVPESMGALDLLAEMRAKRTHLAIVLDEYSGTEGLLTFEDLVEEIVGDVEDEHDDAPEAMLVPLDDGLWEADARAELDDVAEEIDARLGDVEEDVDTLGGLAFVLAGRVPEMGEILDHPESGWKLEIIASDSRRVTRLRLHPPVALEPEAE
ncbi:MULTISPECIES: hemolysin family protein [Sphingobium]|jgi:CBS domain containing-hemolysin-like protein|uniref:hemolysin family protein n=1 Tax=Sphingobium TaxID=165695 RepID=UPI000C3E18DF|nr:MULTISPECIES: hemolysin family protein [Sphingobium]MBS46829.1 magnesium/cobalt efflux protein [Sphingobium sp.]MCC4257785.1 hemolysin family protein [Sphingobium lactosutens]MEC9016451.1 hemolysin family protein [Pseudomonadota bacterium]MEE2741477.1 hemolysin family protein [Pseudomonadota bacterium]|tara:strand:- start:2421 stop:3356 length:936 start_codon:yes stop_codon:yes gene_type:complete